MAGRAAILQALREQAPEFAKLPDETLIQAIGDIHPELRQALGYQTEFEKTNPDVATSRGAELTGKLAGGGETAARFLRDAAILTEATLATRQLGGGQGLQALSRILSGGGIGGAETEGGLSERTKGAAEAAGATGLTEGVMAAPGVVSGLVSGLGTRLGRLGMFFRRGMPGLTSEELGGASKTYIKDVPSLYGPQGEVLATKAAQVPMGEATRDTLSWGRDISKDPRLRESLMRQVATTGAKVGASTAAEEHPEYPLGFAAWLANKLSGGRTGEYGAGRYYGGY